MKDKELDEMISEADNDKDGLINYEGTNNFIDNLIISIAIISTKFALKIETSQKV